MKAKKILLALGTGIIVVFGLLSLRPFPKTTFENSATINGKVELITEKGGEFDITIKLQNNEHTYYINRGVEKGINPNELDNKLTGKEIRIYYSQHWTPLTPFMKSKHITRITHNGTIVYDEIRE